MTEKIDRRGFIKTTVGATLGAVVAGKLPVHAKEKGGENMSEKRAQMIFRGGTIITMDDTRREVKAVAVADGRILAAGDEDEVMKTKGDATKVVDLGGKTLMPSFIDAHGHFMNAPQIVRWANVSGPPVGPVTRIADFVPILQAHVKQQGLKRLSLIHI